MVPKEGLWGHKTLIGNGHIGVLWIHRLSDKVRSARCGSIVHVVGLVDVKVQARLESKGVSGQLIRV